jgi:signal transduction histidine kinase
MNKSAARTILAITGTAMFVAAVKAVLHGETSMRRDLYNRDDFSGNFTQLQQRLTWVSEVADLATWEYDPEMDCFECDDRCRRLFGIEAGQKISFRDFLDRVHPDDRAAVHAALDTAINTRGDYRVVYRIADHNAGWLIVLVRGRAFYNEEGTLHRFFGAALDITEERAAEQALMRADKLALAGRFSAAIAHDVANPIAAALLLIYLARTNAVLPPTIQQNLRDAENELTHAAVICQNALALYRDSPAVEPTNICAVIDGVVALQRNRAQEFGIQVRTEFHCDGDIVINSSELRQILANLISNSIDAMGAVHGGSLRMRVRRASSWKAPGMGYRIIVADTGCGIPLEIRKNLFVPFKTTKQVGGTGLGLWIVKQLVTKYGGNIRVRSRTRDESNASGTTIFVWLPAGVENRSSSIKSRSTVLGIAAHSAA